jgi:hypothetical protein
MKQMGGEIDKRLELTDLPVNLRVREFLVANADRIQEDMSDFTLTLY